MLIIFLFASLVFADTTPPEHRLVMSGLPKGCYVLVSDSTGELAFTDDRTIDLDTSEGVVTVRVFREISPMKIVDLETAIEPVAIEINILEEVIRLLRVLTR